MKQIRAIQKEAWAVLEADRRDMDLHCACCNLQRRPGVIYHLYRWDDGELHFSMLAPEEWPVRRLE